MAKLIVVRRGVGNTAFVPTPDHMTDFILNYRGKMSTRALNGTEGFTDCFEPEVLVLEHEAPRELLEQYIVYARSDDNPFEIYCREQNITRTFSDIID